jgi:DNA-binding transcriptional LysR family regulator
MNLQQMRCLSELVRQELRVSATAKVLSASQPAVTKQLRQLENELGCPLFQREAGRIAGLTQFGEQVVKLAGEVCLSTNTITRLAQETAGAGAGEIKIATTHAQAKFVLPQLMQQFSHHVKKARFELVQAHPREISAAVTSGAADIGVTPEVDHSAKDLRYFTYRSYARLVLVPKKHPLLREKFTLENLARHAIITTSAGFTGHTEVFGVFERNGIKPNVQLTAPDFDVVKVCLERGLGIAILPSFTYNRTLDREIRAIDASGIFPPSVTSIVVRRNRYLPKIVQEFLELALPGQSS